MNTTEIANFIKTPQALNSDEVNALHALCQEHPYSGLMHVLYLKALGNSKSVQFEEQLKKYAIYVPNRELLYHLIHAEETHMSSDEKLDEIAENTAAVDPVIEVLHQEIEEITSHDKPEDLESEAIHPLSFDEPITDTQEAIQEAIETPLEQAEEIEEWEDIAPTLDSKVHDDESWLDNTITFEGFENESVESADANVDTDAEESIIFDFSEELTARTLNIEEEVAGETEIASSENAPVEAPRTKSFYDWLNVSLVLKQPIDDSTGAEAEQIDDALTRVPEAPAIEKSSENPEQKEKVKAIVDKFIETEPRISRPKAEFFSPVKNAKESVNEAGIPVSETLAKIYELQGNYPKAIAVLEKLMELIPGKAAMFEERICAIQSKMAE